MGIKWAFKQLKHQRSAVLGYMFAIAGAMVLVIMFDAVFQGESEKIVAFPKHMNPDLWVMQKGVANMHMASSLLDEGKADSIRQIEGVQAVYGFLYSNSLIEAGDKKWFAYVVGADADRVRPWRVARGKAIPDPGEVIVPDAISRMSDMHIGDKLALGNQQLSIAGFSLDTYSMANSVFFVHPSDLAFFMDVQGVSSYLLVDAKPGVDLEFLAKQIVTQVDNVNVIPHSQFVKNDQSMALQMGVEIITLMSLIGAGLAIVLMSFAVASLVNQSQRDIAVMKALGYGDGTVFGAVITQATVLAFGALIIASLTAYILEQVLPLALPFVTLMVSVKALLKMAIGTTVIVGLVTSLAAHRILRIDPNSAFKN